FFQAEDGIRDGHVTGVQTCALPIYASPGDERQVLDIYSPRRAKNLPVVFWIHGGGWQTGDKSDVQLKPHAFMDKGFVFVSINYRSEERRVGKECRCGGWACRDEEQE